MNVVAPKKIAPMLATLIEQPFDKEGWLFEIKWDGYRALAYKNTEILLLSRNQLSFNQRFPSLVSALKKLPGSFVVDGEIVILDKKGRSNFQLVQNYQRSKQTPYYYVFDILYFNDRDLRGMPLIERKKILKKLLSSRRNSQVRFGDYIEEKGISFFRAVKKKGLEGVIAKKENSTYQSRRSKDWLKIKTGLRQEVVIGGFTQPRGSRKSFGSLLVGVYHKGHLLYAGHVGGGFDEQLLSSVYSQLQKTIASKCPFYREPHPNAIVTWVKPKLVCEVAFAEWTDDGIMRQPIFKGMRLDKAPKEVVKEIPKK